MAVALFALTFAGGSGAYAQSSAIATVHLTPGWVTFGQAVPEGKAVGGLQVEGLVTQTDVKTRWADGSIRFAIVTVKAGAERDYSISAASASGGSFTPAAPAASATFQIGPATYTAAMPSTVGDPWLSGPLVVEGRSVVAPADTSSGVPHPFLRVNFDTRVYNDGASRVDISVENVLDRSDATTTVYDVTLNVNGVQVFSKPAVTHYYLTRWRKVFATSGAFGAVTPDIAPFNESRALPKYLSLVRDTLDDMSTGHYDILESGALEPDMSAHGGRGSLAPFPDWTARYLVHKHPEQRQFVLVNGDMSGSWPIHVRESEDSAFTGVGAGRLVSLNERPLVWYDSRASSDFMQDGRPLDYIKGTPLPIREYSADPTPAPGQSPLIPDNAHQPSLAYVPYLLTGDRYYAEEMEFWADYSMLRTYPADGVRGSDGILENGEVRGYGWALRNIADAAAYSPDSAVSAYLSQKVMANLSWLDAYAEQELNNPDNPLHFLWAGYRPEAGFVSLWEQTYLAYAIDRANRQGFVGGLKHRDVISDLQLKLFTSDPDYPRETTLTETIDTPGLFLNAGTVLTWSAPYLVGIGTADPVGVTYNRTMAEVWAQTNDLNLQRDYAGFYGPEARMNLMTAIENARPGAQEAYDYLFPFIGVNDFWGDGSTIVPDLAARAGWALDFYVTPAPADTAAPVLSLPTSISVFATSASGAVVSYSASANDLVDGSVAVSCLPPSGSTFPIGTTLVRCSATDAAHNVANGSFAITVTNNAPTVTVPADITVRATVETGAVVTFSASAADIEDGALAVVCAPPSGSTFAVATTTVNCTATDSRGATGTSSFTVTVLAPLPPPPPPTGLVQPLDQVNSEGDKVRLPLQVISDTTVTSLIASRSDDDDSDDTRIGRFAASNLPKGLEINKSKGVIKGRVGNDSAGIYTVTVTFTSSSGQTSTKTFKWTVNPRSRTSSSGSGR